MRLVLLGATILALAACGAEPTLPDAASTGGGSSADIRFGVFDGDRHPHVGLMVAKNAAGAPMWKCSGTLMSPTVFLTAGHCTEAPAASVEIWFDADVESGTPANGYPFSGHASGAPHVHPDYDPAAFWLHDLGVVVLDAPVVMPSYGTLPGSDVIDDLARRRGLKDVSFTAVGYGAQWINPVFLVAPNVRMFSTPRLQQINSALTGDYSLLLSNNRATGGTCYGDSGGPNFIGSSNVVGGVTSFGLNGSCGGTGGVYRIDRADDLAWLATFGLTP